jgi:extracellular factor (EF) 3-hydroxypalmitic acid methyl ester biosynthesis protein
MATVPNSDDLAGTRSVIPPRFESTPHTSRPRLAHSRSRHELLDQVYFELAKTTDAVVFHAILDRWIENLREVRLHADSKQWLDWVESCRQHRLRDLLMEDPFTRRSCEKPRGYSGDAVLLDFIYGVEEDWPEPEMSKLGKIIFDYTTRSAAPEGVRTRRAYIAQQIDALATQKNHPSILSVAAGHFREALLCQSLKRRKLGRVVALDADPQSLEVVEHDYGRWGVEILPTNVRSLLTGVALPEQFDLIYSLGLFDYLRESTSRKLINHLFRSLNPGGRLVVANFLPGIKDVGYMEAFMDWNLIYRNRRQLVEMTMDIPEDEVANINLKAEENRNILFLEVTKR